MVKTIPCHQSGCLRGQETRKQEVSVSARNHVEAGTVTGLEDLSVVSAPSVWPAVGVVRGFSFLNLVSVLVGPLGLGNLHPSRSCPGDSLARADGSVLACSHL